MKGRLSIDVRLSGQYSSNEICLDVDDPYLLEAFQPIDVCSSPRDPFESLMIASAGGLDINSQGYQTRIAMRKDIDKNLAEALTEGLLEQMTNNDLDNGYKR